MDKRSTCSVPDCDRRLDCRGLCGTHYKNFRATGIPERPCPGCAVDMVVLGVSAAFCSDACRPHCRIAWCDSRTTGKRDVCKAHYSAILKRGRDPRYGLQKEKRCVSCGAEGWPDNGLRKYCSRRCARLWVRSAGNVAHEMSCVSCGAMVDMFTPQSGGTRKRRTDLTRCGGCARTRNAMSAAELAVRDGSDCSLCGEPVDSARPFPHPLSPSVDHVMPLSRGGGNTPENLALAHLSCNRAKSDTVGWVAPA